MDTPVTPIFDWQIDTPVHEAIFQALGAASMCWSTPEGAGTFDSNLTNRIGEELIAFLQMKLWVPTTDTLTAPISTWKVP